MGDGGWGGEDGGMGETKGKTLISLRRKSCLAPEAGAGWGEAGQLWLLDIPSSSTQAFFVGLRHGGNQEAETTTSCEHREVNIKNGHLGIYSAVNWASGR